MVVEEVRNHWLFNKEQLQWLIGLTEKKDLLIELQNEERKDISYNVLLNALQDDPHLVLTITNKTDNTADYTPENENLILYHEEIKIVNKHNFIGNIDYSIVIEDNKAVIQTTSNIESFPTNTQTFQVFDSELEQKWTESEYYEELDQYTVDPNKPLHSLIQIAHAQHSKGLSFLQVDNGYYYVMYGYARNIGIMYNTPQGYKVVLLHNCVLRDLYLETGLWGK